MSSGGGSSSDSSSTGGYDEAGISTPTTSYESIGTSDSGGNDYSGPTYDEAGVISPTTTTTSDYRDDGPGYNPYASPTSKTASKDFYGAGDGRYDKNVMESGGSLYTNTTDNIQRRIDQQFEKEGLGKVANAAAWAINPIGKATTLGVTALADTIKANYLLGNIKNPFATWSSPAQSYFNTLAPASDNGGDSSGNTQTQVSTPTQTISGVEMESPVQKFYNQQQQTGQLSFQSDYDAAKQKVNGLLGSPSSLGLLAVNESPFYDFLKSINLNRRII